MKYEIKSAPSITRVHTLHRIRTVVNHVTKLAKKRVKIIDDITVANHLISTRLSKSTTDSFRDQIGRRARDHLETARYLGLLYRIKTSRKFTHLPTPSGLKLSRYSFDKECPKDYVEEAIFTDRICRMKFTNSSYMQTPSGYKNYRSRLCLNILEALFLADSSLSLFQIGTILAEPNIDPFINSENISKLVKQVNSKSYETNYLNKLDAEDIRNIRRDTGPFIDWCIQLDLVRSDDGVIRITQRGNTFFSMYREMLPIWWCDLGNWAEAIGASILLINYFKINKDQSAINQLLKNNIKLGLFEINLNEELRSILKQNYKHIFNDTLFDFSFYYDVAPESFDQVHDSIEFLLNKLGYRTSSNEMINFLENYQIQQIQNILKAEAASKTKEISRENIKFKVTAASIFSQFKSPYEASTYMYFKTIESADFRVEKYQAQLSDLFIDSARWKKFSKNNPDLLIINDLIGILECKSMGEWGEYLKIRKSILNEIAAYNDYCIAINDLKIKQKCISVISYEGQIKDEDLKEINKLLKENFPYVIIINQRALQKALTDISFRNSLKGGIKGLEGINNVILV